MRPSMLWPGAAREQKKKRRDKQSTVHSLSVNIEGARSNNSVKLIMTGLDRLLWTVFLLQSTPPYVRDLPQRPPSQSAQACVANLYPPDLGPAAVGCDFSFGGRFSSCGTQWSWGPPRGPKKSREGDRKTSPVRWLGDCRTTTCLRAPPQAESLAGDVKEPGYCLGYCWGYCSL